MNNYQRPLWIHSFMKMALLLWLGLYCAAALSAQTNEELNEKELLQELASSKEDIKRVLNLRELAEYYLGPKTDTSLILIKEALDLSEKINSDKGKINSLYTMGKVFVYMGNYTRGLGLYFQSLELSEQNKEPEWIVNNLSNIGEVYGYQGDYQQALHYFFKGTPIAQKNHLNGRLAWFYMNIGKTYESLNRLDSARLYTLKSYELVRQVKDDYLTGKILYSLGVIYSKTGDPPRAMKFYRLSMLESDKVLDYAITCDASLGMATLLSNAGNKDSALYYARLSLAMANKADFLLQKLNASAFLASYFKEKKMFDSAFAYIENSVTLKDSLLSKEKISEFQKISFSEQLRQQESLQARVQYRNRIKMFVLLGGLSALLAVSIILWRNIRLKQKANILLTAQKSEIDKQKDKIETSYGELKSAQAQLIQSEKMASLGELTAGIAHEIQNPLNFVNNFSEVSAELMGEMEDEINKGNHKDVKNIASDIKQNLEKIIHHGKRAESIVKGMLQHSRNSTGKKESTDINALADEYLRLSWHGLRAKDKSFNAILQTEFDPHIGQINIIPQDMGRVLLNLYNNAFYSVNEKKKQSARGDSPDKYEPMVTVTTKALKSPLTGGNSGIEISVKDNGHGIPQKVVDKIFQPFFTTKPTGQGTGLGLSLSYDIIKAHGGEIKVDTKEGDHTVFIITLPFHSK
ncbi:MAG: multi-sensor signal transduction histidine kinase [Chitinophagaceae bacterium]|nr:multi-sensor signal transduction histidine kinase [Chitinophagaceae bacterium]